MSSNVNIINRVLPGLIEPAGKMSPMPTPTMEPGVIKTDDTFGKLFSEFVNSVNELHTDAGEAKKALLAGEPVELHQVMIQGEKAGIATDLLLEIRNRLVNGFNEIMRMPM